VPGEDGEHKNPPRNIVMHEKKRGLPRALYANFSQRGLRGNRRLNSREVMRLSALQSAIQVSSSQLRALLIDLAVHMYFR